MKTVILAGGMGTRLKDVLGELPKPMAPIGGRPFLEYLISLLNARGMSEFVFCIGHGGEKIQDHFAQGDRFGVSIRYTTETRLLGTAGAIKLTEHLIDSEDFFVVNGDTYLEADPHTLLRFHRMCDAAATIALVRKENTGRYGRVALGRRNDIHTFEEKGREGKAGYINGGLYVFRKEFFDNIPEGKACSLEREILPRLTGKGLYGFPVDGYFLDIGTREDYEKARRELPLRRKS